MRSRTYLVVLLGWAGSGCGSGDAWVVSSQLALQGPAASDAQWSSAVLLDNGCSGVLLASDIVIYAAHCGEATRVWSGTSLPYSTRDGVVLLDPNASPSGEAAVQACTSYPSYGLVDAPDIAFCQLSSSLEGPIVPPVRGCESNAVKEGALVTLAGFGVNSLGQEPGIKRVVTSTIEAVGREVKIGGEIDGPCSGDSGSPAFINLAPSNQEGKTDWRVLGILSTGLSGETCGVGYYTPLWSIVPWIEESTQTRIAPCFEGDAWRASPRCTRPPIGESGSPQESREIQSASTCGPPFDPSVGDSTPPVIVEANAHLDETGTLKVDAEARDVGWGIQEVQVQVLDEQLKVLRVKSSGLSKARFEVADLSERPTSVRITAVDFAGQTASVQIALTQRAHSAGCSVSSGNAAPPYFPWGLTLLFVTRLRRSRAR